MFEPTGYADEGRELLLAMERAGIEPALRPVLKRAPGFAEMLSPHTRAVFAAQAARAPKPGYVLAQHFPADGFVTSNVSSFNVGRTMFETDSLAPNWVTRCNALDELWVPSQFNVDSFRRAGVTVPMHCVPGGIDSMMYRPDVEPRHIPGARGTVFLAVLEWRRRKGWDVLLRAWADAFTPADDVTLVLRASPSALRASADSDDVGEVIDAFVRAECGGRSRPDLAPIVLLRDTLAAADMPALYTAAHAYVAPTRGEGWGRPFMEAMASGVPVIATRWSAHLEYMNDANSLLLDVHDIAGSNDPDAPVYAGQHWAEPSHPHLVSLLQRVHRDRAEARAIGAQARRDMVEHWPWSRAADTIKARLAAIVPHQVLVPVEKSPKSKTQIRVVAQAHVFGAQRPTPGLEALMGALVQAARARSDSSLGIECKTDSPVRPSASSPAIHAWPAVVQNRTVPTQADITITWLDGDGSHVPARPVHGRWIVATADVVSNRVPESLLRALRDDADEVWVPHEAARATLMEAGVRDECVWVLPFGNIAAECTPHGARFANGALEASRPGTTFLLTVLHEHDIQSAETVVRIWQRAVGDADARLSILLPAPIASPSDSVAWHDSWPLRLVSMLGERERRVSFTMLPADLGELGARMRAADVVIDAGSAPSSVALWHTALAAGRPLIAMRSADAEQHIGEAAGWLVPAGMSRAMNGRDLTQALFAASDASVRSAMSVAARTRAESMLAWRDVAAVALERVHALHARSASTAAAGAAA